MTNMDDMVKAIGANYAVWNEDTTITLCNVRWDSEYRNIVKFKDKAALNTYLESDRVKHTSTGKARYVKADEPIKLPLPIDQVYPYNYVRVHNPKQKPVNGEELYYYYFIIGVDFTAPGVTTIRVQLDVWQTFGDKAQFSSAFVEQGHIGIANEKQFDDYGRKYLTTPEGLDTGAELITSNVGSQTIMDKNNASVAMVCAANLFVDPETSEGKPELSTGSGNYVQGVPSGVPTYFFKSIPDFILFTQNYAKYPWITSAIKSVTLIPNAFANGEKYNEIKLAKGNVSVYQQINSSDSGHGRYVTIRTNWRSQILVNMPNRYKHLLKFLTYPYSAVEMTLFQGSNVVLKPERWQSDDAKIAIKSSNMTPGQKLMIYARGYGATTTSRESTQTNAAGGTEYYYDGGDYLENAVVMDNFPTMALTGDAGNLSLAQNYNSIAQQRKTADWSQQKALQSAQTAYDQSSAQIGNMEGQGQIDRWVTQRNNDVANQHQAIGGGISAGSSLLSGNPIGAAATAGSTLNSIVERGRNTDTSLAASRATQRNNIGTAEYMRNSNSSLADFAARGDYATTIATINAKVQDTALTPPFSVGAAGGEQFLLTQANGITLYFLMKMLSPGEMMRIGEYWLRYGYQINTYVRNIPADLMCMTNFTYWRFSETVLIATYVPEWVKNAIRGIFEKGVTVWSDPSKIGSIDIADNVAKTGISY